jgi:hypothetical protein
MLGYCRYVCGVWMDDGLFVSCVSVCVWWKCLRLAKGGSVQFEFRWTQNSPAFSEKQKPDSLLPRYWLMLVRADSPIAASKTCPKIRSICLQQLSGRGGWQCNCWHPAPFLCYLTHVVVSVRKWKRCVDISVKRWTNRIAVIIACWHGFTRGK